MNIAGFQIPSDSRLFLTILAIHVPVGMVAVVTGVAAMLRNKRRGAHTKFGSIYFWSLSVLFITSTWLAAMRWREDYYLFFLGALSFGVAVTGRTARRQRWKMPIDLHIVGMGVSYIAMLTAFYVDNGKSLPIWRDLPPITYWLLPSAVGVPLIFGRWLATKMSLLTQALYPRAVWPRRRKQITAGDDRALRSGARTREIDRRHQSG